MTLGRGLTTCGQGSFLFVRLSCPKGLFFFLLFDQDRINFVNKVEMREIFRDKLLTFCKKYGMIALHIKSEKKEKEMELPRSCTSDEVFSEEPPGFLPWPCSLRLQRTLFCMRM